jgi:hypothetical protein
MRNLLPLGYTFMFKGQHCSVIKRLKNRFEYSTIERPSGNFMYYNYFQNTPHFRSKWPRGRQKSLDFKPGFLPLVEKIVKNIKEGKSPNQKIYML